MKKKTLYLLVKIYFIRTSLDQLKYFWNVYNCLYISKLAECLCVLFVEICASITWIYKIVIILRILKNTINYSEEKDFQWIQKCYKKNFLEMVHHPVLLKVMKLFFPSYIYSPRNYRRQKAIAFDIVIKEKIIGNKFLLLIIYLQFSMNLPLFCWRSFLSYQCLLFYVLWKRFKFIT